MHTILFDLDGTLVNSEWLAKEAYNYGIETVLKRKLTNEERESLVGKPIAVFEKISKRGRANTFLDIAVFRK